MRIAVTRPVPESLARCELTHVARVPIDVVRAAEEHRQYEETLRALGCTVRHAPAAHDLPDSVFVEDVAVVLDEGAIITRPGAASRRPERESIAQLLAEYLPLRAIGSPGTLDGGDVLRIGRRIYVGVSSRTNDEGIRQLAQLAEPLGYTVTAVRTAACLHLKSAVTALGPDRVLCNPAWIDARLIRDVDVVPVDPAEPQAANVLAVGAAVVCAAAHVRTADRLRRDGFDVHAVDVSELAKAEAGVTCCSLLFDVSGNEGVTWPRT